VAGFHSPDIPPRLMIQAAAGRRDGPKSLVDMPPPDFHEACFGGGLQDPPFCLKLVKDLMLLESRPRW
jgi:hypothetical protein